MKCQYCDKAIVGLYSMFGIPKFCNDVCKDANSVREMLYALHVITKTPHIVKYLIKYDPQAFKQCEDAIKSNL